MKRMIALITGASRGIGNATAYEFAKNGYDLVLTCQHSKTKLHAFAQKLKNEFHIQTLCCCGDIGDYEFVRQMFDEIADFGKGVDILINNAGVSYIGLLSEMSYADWNQSNQHLCLLQICHSPHAFPKIRQNHKRIVRLGFIWGFLRSRLFRRERRGKRLDKSPCQRTRPKRHSGQRRRIWRD